MATGALCRKPGYWAVLPARVRYDEELRPNAKLIYAEITALADSTGFCWATNKYLSDLFGLSKKTVSDLIGTLEKKGYIQIEVVRDEKGAVSDRKIYVDRVSVVVPDPIPKNGDRYPQNNGYPIPKNGEENNININNNPPIVPHEGDGVGEGTRKRKRVPKSVPDWEPEMFERFWKAYPRGKDRQGAVREWDNLKPSRKLMMTMSAALLRQKDSEDWQRGIGIPYACRWLSNRRWEDEDRAQPEPRTSGAGDGGEREEWT